jgi:hypothetical protein
MARVEASTVLNREPDEEAALAIDLAVLCSELHVLPRAGGVLDQDPYELYLLRAGLSGLNKKVARERELARAQQKIQNK